MARSLVAKTWRLTRWRFQVLEGKSDEHRHRFRSVSMSALGHLSPIRICSSAVRCTRSMRRSWQVPMSLSGLSSRMPKRTTSSGGHDGFEPLVVP
jgi:hypothetical protein